MKQISLLVSSNMNRIVYLNLIDKLSVHIRFDFEGNLVHINTMHIKIKLPPITLRRFPISS